ncbi:MAG TPA: recombinase family protein, partial [Azospirillaceae bacterium]|nr:recombinase family protein [Azospirillaceae bacterium]
RWTGSRPPFGYNVETSKVSGKPERRLAIDDVEATVVQLIFALRLGGQVPGAGKEPVAPKGVKKIAGFLNKNGYTTREGRRFSLGTVHKILTNQTYAGTYIYGRMETRTGTLRAPEK